MAVRIEDSGFEVRDMIAWVYGSGFPKSMDISKAIDKQAGVERKDRIVKTGATSNSLENRAYQVVNAGSPATAESQQWSGWGTALKPALEPITVARKPFEGTVADNVIEHGTGAMNIDACRIEVAPDDPVNSAIWTARPSKRGIDFTNYKDGERISAAPPEGGRWPANLIHDGSDEVVELFPETGPSKASMRGEGKGVNTPFNCRNTFRGHDDMGGSAARFFYCAKAAKSDRGEGNIHPTVKPVALMEYLIKLVTPQGDQILEPFGGSGTTLIAAERIGMRCSAIELNPQYCDVIVKRWETLTGQKAVLEADNAETE